MASFVSKVWPIARHQFREEVFKRGFVIAVASLPLFLAISVGAGYMAVTLSEETVKLGIVDLAGTLADLPPHPYSYDLDLHYFASVEEAEAALTGEEIQAYYLIPPDFDTSRSVELLYRERPPWDARRFFSDALRLSLLADAPAEVAVRAISGPSITFRSEVHDRDYPGGDPSAGQVVPIVAAVVYVFLILSASGMMMQAVVQEKENRTMEIVLTSVSPGQMMAGKILGIASVAVVQFVVWVICLVGAAWLAGAVLATPWLQDIRPDWADLAKLTLLAGPAFLFVTAAVVAVSSSMVETQDTQQLGGLLYLFLFVPLYLVVPIIQHPDGPVATVLGMVPVTSVLTNAMRMLVWSVPIWEILAATAVSLVSAIAMAWFAGRTLRLGMLRYGKRVTFREIAGGSGT